MQVPRIDFEEAQVEIGLIRFELDQGIRVERVVRLVSRIERFGWQEIIADV